VNEISENELFEIANNKGISEEGVRSSPTGNHFVLSGSIKDKPVIFKALRKPELKSRTLAEIYALDYLAGKLSETFETPKLLDWGSTYTGVIWFISTRFPDSQIDGNAPECARILAQATVSVIRSGLEIPHRDQPRKDAVSHGNGIQLLKEVIDHADDMKKGIRRDVSRLTHILNQFPLDEVATASLHGDIVPKHIVRIGESQRFGIYDWELCGGAYFFGYEPADVFQRLYTREATPDIARLYLSELVKLLTVNERQSLISTFRPMLAYRIIGGLFYYNRNTSKSYKNIELATLTIKNENMINGLI